MTSAVPTSPTIVLVSRPLGPPWRDGSSKLVMELLSAIAELHVRVRYRAFADPGVDLFSETVDWWSIPPGPRQNVRIGLSLLTPGEARLYHFFFAPHPLGTAMARASCLASGAVPVQTICSLPNPIHRARWLCFGRKVVVLSRWMQARLEAAGVCAKRIVRIPPPLSRVPRPEEERVRLVREHLGLGDSPIVLFAGDAEPGGGLQTLVAAVSEIWHATGARTVVTCRTKSALGLECVARAKADIRGAGLDRACRFLGAVDDFRALLACADVFALPATSLKAKIDYPYALLEAMSLGVPSVVCEGTPPEELLELGGGMVIPTSAPRALARSVIDVLTDEDRRARLGVVASRIVAERCNPRRVAEAYLSLHEDLLIGSGRRRARTW